ncbi:MAG TPA: LysM peptidoglycan-binding domain-containing protein [Vicinamibacterales bacterium]|nr:LysM peptidoglycan-binding domain-containing protein [Vicinamibacterales bacterium]
MPSKRYLPIVPVLGALLIAGCVSQQGATAVKVVPVAPAPVVPQIPPPPPAPDPIAILIATSDTHFEAGRKELAVGHLQSAKAEFDRALDTLLESPGGARADARLREHFERLVDRISVLEQAALTAGDGFSETKSEPAAIDALLAIETFETTAPKAATAETVEADLQATTHDIPIPTNDRVLRYVELFQGRLREFLSEGLSRGVQYLPMIQATFRAEGLPLDLAYIPLIESAFKPSAVSRVKARGVWQFMRGTALENGLRADWYLDERADPTKATQAAAKYLKALHGMFEDWHLAMASYNGGPGRVKRALTRSRKNDFWQLTSTTKFLPRETRDYVPMILAAIIIAKNPAQYGFDIVPVAPTVTETVTVPPALDLRRVAEWAEVPMDDIQALNPEFRRWTTPVKKGEYTIKVPQGTAEKVRGGLASAEPGQLNAMQFHTVKRGETIATIAKKLGVNRTDLAEANYLKITSRVNAGARLIIPRMPSAALLARASSGELENAAETIVADVLERTTEETKSPVTPSHARTYKVRSGDTLSAIARKTGTTITQLQNWNKLHSTNIKVGTQLLVQSPSRTKK